MALIELFPVIADEYPVASGVTIIAGQFATLETISGSIVIGPATGASGEFALGIAGDTKSQSALGTINGGSEGVVDTNGYWVGASSTNGQYVNRVSDTFDETKASGKMTVYHSGGKFATNMFVTSPQNSYVVNQPLYVSYGNVSGVTNQGLLTNDSTDNLSGQVVARLVATPAAYESGVPGLDVNGSMTLGNYMEIKLVI